MKRKPIRKPDGHGPGHTVIFQPMGVRARVPDGANLRDAARQAGVLLDSLCGERAACGKCRVIVQRGTFHGDDLTSQDDHLSPPGPDEAAYWAARAAALTARGEDPVAYRLACQASVQGDLVVLVPESSRAVRQTVRKSAGERAIDIRPVQRKLYAELEPATLADPLADWERLTGALAAPERAIRTPASLPLDPAHLSIDLPALRDLQAVVRSGGWKVTATLSERGEVIRVEPGFSEALYGLAVDVGTTTIVAHLCDLHSGEVLATADAMNPQAGLGEDVMSRISYAAAHPGGGRDLQRAVLECLNGLARKAARQARLKASAITALVVVGNSVMHHLLLGIDPQPLGFAPYVPAIHTPFDLRARDLGLTALNTGALVHLLPLPASFVGADTMGVLLAEAPHEQDECWLIVDVGTNAELVLGNRRRLVCTSTPTGPAFEGAHIESGMRAAPGAIERVEIDPQTLLPRFRMVECDLWSDQPGAPTPLGICGSGIIDAVAELVRVGLVRLDGRFDAGRPTPALRRDESGRPFYLLAEPAPGQRIAITQEDIRQVQLAKAPLYVAAHYLMAAFGIERPDRILLAGGFGSRIDPLRALILGMIPDCPPERVLAVGNAAGD
ncbi:MAG: DUF4445 domain-containing protein, partial [Anaerolineae bacterium]|nr:DUF4445 domain-containing protein [Anaerolineae bacterium]